MTLAEVLGSAGTRLGNQSEADILVLAAFEAATGRRLSRSELVLEGGEPWPDVARQILEQWLSKRQTGVPVQHLTGEQVFLDHRYRVGPQVLIPRPETEVLVSAITEELKRNGAPPLGWEFGLGSGVISIELLATFRELKMIASEWSEAATRIAQENARTILGQLASDQLVIVRPQQDTDVLEPLFDWATQNPERPGFIVANPPYLIHGSDEVTPEVARHEPHMALFAPAHDALYFYRKLFEQAAIALMPRGQLWMEIPHERAGEIIDLGSDLGWEVAILDDLTGRPRVARAIARVGTETKLR